jgi:hypothetical protein
LQLEVEAGPGKAKEERRRRSGGREIDSKH